MYPRLRMRLENGSHLGPYEITGWIGAGGMGEVYRARDTRLGREVAIKVLPRAMFGDAERLARFRREAVSASALNHRNIVTVHDFTSTGEEAWLVMELIGGESLGQIISGRAMPFKRVLEIGNGIAEGLAAAHAAGIVHRDLKPDNVMVASDDTPKILDFGLVKQATSSDPNSETEVRNTREGVVMGTAAYMSPEQARGEIVDFRSDQFSFGLILHEMATGKHPFRRSSGIETIAAILNDEPLPLGEGFSPFFVEIVSRCLSKRKEDRYGSTADLAHDLRLVGSRTNSGMQVATKFKSNRSWGPLAAAALIAALAMAAAIGAFLLLRPQSEASNHSYLVSVATPEFAEVFRNETALPVALSPDGRYLAVYGADENTNGGLSLHDLRSGATRVIAQNAFSVGWSPDSRMLAFFADGKLKTISIDGGPPRVLCAARPESSISWKGDDILFVQYSVERPGIYRVRASGGAATYLRGGGRKGGGTTSFWPEFLPDGKHFLYLTLHEEALSKGVLEHELFVGSVDGGEATKVDASIDSRAVYSNGHLLFVRDGTLLAQQFDLKTSQLSGEARPLVQGVHYFRSTGLAAFSVSDNGVVAWRAAVAPSRLVWFDRLGTELKEIGVAAYQQGGRISADGRRYAVGIIDPQTGISDVWIHDLLRDSSERATFRMLDEKSPVWSIGDESMYYRGDGQGPPDIFRLIPGREIDEVVYAGEGVEEPHDVSPDGNSLLFVQYRQSADIRILPLKPSGAPRTLLATPFNEVWPRFSPDGRSLAYQSDVSGRPEVYVKPLDGVGASTRISRDGGTHPRWHPEGKELFFLAPGGKIMSAVMQDGASAGIPRILFQAAGAVDLEPAVDGQRFLIQLEQRRMEPPVRLLINWPARVAAGATAQ